MNESDDKKLRELLLRYWGYSDFRPVQKEAISALIAGNDVMALMPTGAGKSLIYQLPALMLDGVCIVITPLIALMKDQVDNLRRRGVQAAAIHSGLSRNQIDLTLDNAAWGDLKLLYISPERIQSAGFCERIARMKVSLIAVDEAHCISQWGYDFRPSYLRIARLREVLKGVAMLALTASATPEVARDIAQHLKLHHPVELRSSFERANISFAVRWSDDKFEQLLRVLTNVSGRGIVYMRTRDGVEKLGARLTEQGIGAECYHGGLGQRERSARQERWSSGQSRVMVATNAFGMGIDKPDVRFVVHYDMCDSLEAYYQEAGRAGRDGKRAYALLLCSSDEHASSSRRLAGEFPEIEKIKKCYEILHNYLQIGIGDGKYASFAFNPYEFATYAGMFTATALNALKILQQNGYLTLTEEHENPPRIMFNVSRDELYRVRIEREELDHILRTILRLYEGVFSGRFIPIDQQEIAHYSGYTEERVQELLKNLWQLRVISYIPSNRSPILMLHEERLPLKDVYISPESHSMRRDMALKRLEAMIGYSLANECRSMILCRYFGQTDAAPCGSCDRCIEQKKRAAGDKAILSEEELRGEVVTFLEKEPLTIKELISRFGTDPQNIIMVIERLSHCGIIYTRVDGKIVLKR